MKWLLLLCILLALAPPATAYEVRLTLNWGTYHFDRDADYREDNWMVSAEIGLVHVATFINSHGNRSHAFGTSVRQPVGEHLEYGVHLSLIHGYTEKDLGLAPCIAELHCAVKPYALVWLNDGAGLKGGFFGSAVTAGAVLRF